MTTAASRITTSVSLSTDIMNILKKKVQQSNSTIDAYIERLLADEFYADEPNETTHKAIMDTKKEERNPKEVYDSVEEMMKDLLKA